MTGYRSYSHSVQFFRPVKAIVRTDEANSMAFLQREFLPSNDTYKTKTSAGKTLKFICGNENVTHSAQGETVFLGENFLFRISEYTQRERECLFRKLQIFISQTTDSHFANYRFSFPKLQIFISQTTDSSFRKLQIFICQFNYRFSFRKLQILMSQTTDFHFANYRFSFRKLQIFISQTTDFHFANCRFSFRKLQIFISQTTDSHFANYRFPFRKLQISISQTTDFHFVSSHFVSQTTVSPVNDHNHKL